MDNSAGRFNEWVAGKFMLTRAILECHRDEYHIKVLYKSTCITSLFNPAGLPAEWIIRATFSSFYYFYQSPFTPIISKCTRPIFAKFSGMV